MSRVIDRRQEFSTARWVQGRVDQMDGYAALQRAPAAFQAQCVAHAQCMALTEPQGRRAGLVIHTFSSAKDCADAVAAHNATLASASESA